MGPDMLDIAFELRPVSFIKHEVSSTLYSCLVLTHRGDVDILPSCPLSKHQATSLVLMERGITNGSLPDTAVTL